MLRTVVPSYLVKYEKNKRMSIFNKRNETVYEHDICFELDGRKVECNKSEESSSESVVDDSSSSDSALVTTSSHQKHFFKNNTSEQKIAESVREKWYFFLTKFTEQVNDFFPHLGKFKFEDFKDS